MNRGRRITLRLSSSWGMVAIAAVTAFLAPPAARAQNPCVIWRQHQTHPLSSHLYFDLSQRAVVSVEEGLSNASKLRLRKWTGSAWVDLPTSTTEFPREGFGMAYDAARQRLVLCCGQGYNSSGGVVYRASTIEFNGTAWSIRSTTGPSGRTEPAMAYDAGRQRVVLFGGANAGGVLGDTWEWDGTAWVQRATTGIPARRASQMTYDFRRHKIVLFGGIEPGSSGNKRDTYEWDGETWTKRNDFVAWQHATSWTLWDPEAQRVVMWCADQGSTAFDHRLVWTGDAWEGAPFGGPPYAGGGGEAILPVYNPVFGEFDVQTDDRAMWSGTEGNWTQRMMGYAEMGHVINYDPIRDQYSSIVMVSSFPTTVNETIVTERHPWGFASHRAGSAPGGWRGGSQIAFHNGAAHAVSLGGIADSWEGTTYYHNDTALWDGTSWVSSYPSPSPGGRAGCDLVYDSARGRVVLFGGWITSAGYADTWEWDGTAWTRVLPTGPEGLASRLAYDSVRGKVLLYGAPSYGTSRLETWEYDGASWTLLNSAGPRVTDGASIAYDAGLNRVLLFGGKPATGGSGNYDQTFTWEGTSWKQLKNLKLNPRTDSEQSTTLLYDSSRQRMMLLPGYYELSRQHDITRQPDAKAVNAGRNAAFLVSAADPDAVTYRWRRDGVPLNDGGRISGATQRVLVITDVEPGDAGVYDAVVSSACASVTSDGAALTVLCPADLNRDGFVSADDFDSFAFSFDDGAPRADFDENGFVNGDDFDRFSEAFAGGC